MRDLFFDEDGGGVEIFRRASIPTKGWIIQVGVQSRIFDETNLTRKC